MQTQVLRTRKKLALEQRLDNLENRPATTPGSENSSKKRALRGVRFAD